MTDPVVSVLVPTYNAAPYLPELCQSIQAQTYKNFEALILDDGSTDNTRAVLSSYEKDNRFRILGWKQNRGLNAALRELLNLARGKYWTSPGADDVLLPEFLERRVALLEARPEAAIVHGVAKIIDESGKSIPSPFPKMNLPLQIDGHRALGILLQHNIIHQPSALVRSEVTQKILPFYQSDWKYAPDWHLWILHAATGFDLLWDVQPLHKYRVHSRSLSFDPAKAATRRAEIRLVPLCALSAAVQFSPLAADLWSKWRQTLYRLWLFRAARLRAEGRLQPEWLRLAGRAYYGKHSARVSLLRELCRHGLSIPFAGLRERQALKKQSFRVSGIAQINDPVFR